MLTLNVKLNILLLREYEVYKHRKVSYMKSFRFILQGLHCPNCAKKIESKVASIEGYENVIVNFSTLTLSFKTDKEKGVEEVIKKIVKSIEPDVKVVSNDEKIVQEVQRDNKDIIRWIVGVVIY